MRGATTSRRRSSPDAGRKAVLCAGIAVLDHAFMVDVLPARGAKSRARAFREIGGGCAANAAVAIARLGGRAELVSPIGDDTIGDAIVAGLQRERVGTAGVMRLPGAASPISAILIDATGERTIVNYRDERLPDARAPNPDQSVARADAVLVDNRFAAFVLPIAAAARRRGIPVVLDGDQPLKRDDPLLAAATHVVFSGDALRRSAASDDLDAALRDFAGHTSAFLAVTDGANDMRWVERGTVARLPVFSTNVVDTLAAGDVFHGAFALAIAEGLRERDAIRFAAATAAIKCSGFGGIAGAPSRAEVQALLDRAS
jgi:sugar/nucleoside kinase (ribokinase family)